MVLVRRMMLAAGMLGALLPVAVARGQEFLRGDANADGKISISDSLTIRRYGFNGDFPPPCLDAADVNDNGIVDITDEIRLINALFWDVPPPPPLLGVLGADATEDDLACAHYEVVEPSETEDVIRLGNVAGAPGENVEIPVYLTNSVDVEAFQLMIAYDSSLFEPSIFEPRRTLSPDLHGKWTGLSFAGSFYGFLDSYSDLEAFLSVTPSPVADILAIGFMPDLLFTGLEVPPGQDRLIFKILGKIPDTAAPGTVVSLEPTNGTDGAGVGPYHLRNELTHRGDARYVSIIPKTIPGILKIVPDFAIFMRGDSNRDQKVDLSDAQFTLSFLFLGGDAPPCADAADANDDGRIDVSDAIATLEFLYLGKGTLPAPGLTSGADPTDDALECAQAGA